MDIVCRHGRAVAAKSMVRIGLHGQLMKPGACKAVVDTFVEIDKLDACHEARRKALAGNLAKVEADE